MPFVDYYKQLGVSQYATPLEIKAAFRKLSKQYHPDLNGSDPFYAEKFIQVKTAYEVLSNADTKRVYQGYYDEYYNPPPQPQYPPQQQYYQESAVTAVTAVKPVINKRTILLCLIPVGFFLAIVIGSEVFSSDQKAQSTTISFKYDTASTLPLTLSPILDDFSNSTFKITLHEYTDYDTAFKTFTKLSELKYKVGFVDLGNVYRIDMPFVRPLSDTAIVKDSIEKIFDTKCTVNF